MKTLFSVTAFACAFVLATSTARAEEKTIVEIAVASKNLTKLVAAVKAAGLVETLSGEGPFTVLAPTDKAFEALGEEKLTAVLKDKELLTKILKAHVIQGSVMAKDVVGMDGKMVKPLAGEFMIAVKGKGVMIGKAKVIKTDIKAKNGVIHLIDTVLIPE